MKSIYYTECLVCNSRDSFEKSIETIDYSISKEEFTILKCNNCGFTFTDNIPKVNEIGKYYQSPNYISHSDSSKGIINKIYHIVRDYTLTKKLKLINELSQNKKTLFDYGCGTGYFLEKAKKYKWKVGGYELDDKTRKIAENRVNEVLDIEIKYINKKFQIISLWHVLEHIHDLDQTIKSIYDINEEKGYLIIAVPNLDSFDAKYYKKYWAALDVPRHLYHFTENSLEKLMVRYNYQLKFVKPMLFDSVYVSMLSEKYKNPKQNSLINILKGFTIGLISNLTAKNNNYSSKIYVFQKK